MESEKRGRRMPNRKKEKKLDRKILLKESGGG